MIVAKQDVVRYLSSDLVDLLHIYVLEHADLLVIAPLAKHVDLLLLDSRHRLQNVVEVEHNELLVHEVREVLVMSLYLEPLLSPNSVSKDLSVCPVIIVYASIVGDMECCKGGSVSKLEAPVPMTIDVVAHVILAFHYKVKLVGSIELVVDHFFYEKASRFYNS